MSSVRRLLDWLTPRTPSHPSERGRSDRDAERIQLRHLHAWRAEIDERLRSLEAKVLIIQQRRDG